METTDSAKNLTCGGHEDFGLDKRGWISGIKCNKPSTLHKAAVKKCAWNLFAKAGSILGSLDSSI